MLQTGQVKADGDDYGLIVSGVLAVLTAIDPYGLLPGNEDGAPSDEYTPEAIDVARILLEHGNVTVEEVEAVWLSRFSESLTARIGSSCVAQLVRDLNDVPRNGR
ncbi:hypothetical protein [Curtobacterium sp. ISL-83]|uniref:hypothetical protein n=1 Tax=Curtobacterium sp. ISL-83 TaxID=2819145 RepID=UPI001BE88BA4|nr:hypothetical protein [Curtobacterium sp. ISL-83]MBT2501065.1 hypothetical protein [Curtobacterium sp. ISL-83]